MHGGLNQLKLVLAGVAITALYAYAQLIQYPGEELFFKDIQQITPDVDARDGAISPDGKWICWVGPVTKGNISNDQVWIMPAIGGEPRMILTVAGRAADPVFIPGRDALIFSASDMMDSRALASAELIVETLWRLDMSSLYMAEINGSGTVQLSTSTSTTTTTSSGYDGQPDVSPDGQQIVFASTRDGDLDLYLMDIVDMVVIRLTDSFGYDCQPRFTPDGQWILYSSYEPKTDSEKQRYTKMLGAGVVSAPEFEICMIRTDGTQKMKITDLHSISLSPCKHPKDDIIVFMSKPGKTDTNPSIVSSEFDLFTVDFTGTILKQVTTNPEFDGSPRFSKDGSRLIWTSLRANRSTKASRSNGIYSAVWHNPLSPSSESIKP